MSALELTGKEITGLGEKPSPRLRVCGFLPKAPLICHPVAFSRQAGREELLSEVPAGWKAEEGKTLTQLLRAAGLSPAAPPWRKACACSAYLRQEIEKGSQGLAPGKRPGQAPCRTRHRAILISSPGPTPPVQDPRGNEAAGRNVVGRL